ncbi:hypothetical protein ACIA8K_27600 [Catenuloplanes sp. NPDC051500]|uniref:hypothetical protein n=1 Tax=Catenuloplanes sp. NPDC051500 TaxID=3363959 RepID=UPI0037964FAC
MSVSLVDELLRIAAEVDDSLNGITAGRDRFGPADALLSTVSGHVSVRSGCAGGYELAIWARDEIVAEGQTNSLPGLVDVMVSLRRGVPMEELCRRHTFLRVVDSGMANEPLWHLLLAHSEAKIRVVAAAVGANPVLRSLRPWVSHGTLHLIHSMDRVDSARYGLAFHPAEDGMFRLNVYGEGAGSSESLESCILRAAAVVVGWRSSSKAHGE